MGRAYMSPLGDAPEWELATTAMIFAKRVRAGAPVKSDIGSPPHSRALGLPILDSQALSRVHPHNGIRFLHLSSSLNLHCCTNILQFMNSMAWFFVSIDLRYVCRHTVGSQLASLGCSHEENTTHPSCSALSSMIVNRNGWLPYCQPLRAEPSRAKPRCSCEQASCNAKYLNCS